MKTLNLVYGLLFLAFSIEGPGYAQPAPPSKTAATASTINKKLNLEDITVKGELLSDDRMNFVRRQREELKNRIRFRTNFRSEILQEYKN